jgi:hypothetical protein
MAKYDRNSPFNELHLLPTAKGIDNDPDILKKLVKASRALATVNSNVLRLPNPDMLINTISLQEAKTSTAIENICFAIAKHFGGGIGHWKNINQYILI